MCIFLKTTFQNMKNLLIPTLLTAIFLTTQACDNLTQAVERRLQSSAPRSAGGTVDSLLHEFAINASMAHEIMYRPWDELPKGDILYELKDRGMYYWGKNLRIIEQLRTQPMSDSLRLRCDSLRVYCLRANEVYGQLYECVSNTPEGSELNLSPEQKEKMQQLSALNEVLFSRGQDGVDY
jgi:hypothetical protein